MATYFGFAIADSMFPEDCTVTRYPLTPAKVTNWLSRNTKMCLNPSHKPTIDAAIARFNLPITIPDKAPVVKLGVGDRVIVMSVRGLPRLEGRHEYTADEINNAAFAFGMWIVTG